MKKYNPDESITCPKCGKTYKAEVMNVTLINRNLDGSGVELLRLYCLCNWDIYHRPLDYEELKDALS